MGGPADGSVRVFDDLVLTYREIGAPPALSDLGAGLVDRVVQRCVEYVLEFAADGHPSVDDAGRRRYVFSREVR